jgi:hypothetical protein
MDSFSGGRPRPQPSRRPAGPAPAIDLRPPTAQPGPVPQPDRPTVHKTPDQTDVFLPPTEPRPTTAELIARHEQATRKDSGGRRNLLLAIAGLIIIVAVAIIFVHRAPAKPTGPFPASITSAQITIPVYYPKNLPAGFEVSGSKVVKQDNLRYVVTSPNKDNFYVNIQPIPSGYDFSAFDERFTDPTTYQTTIGTATTGLMNNELICSIHTAKSWILINSTATKATADMSTIAKALKPASL